MSYSDFGQVITARRKKKKLSQPQLAELLKSKGIDIKANSISKWEKNVNSPSVLQFFALCEILEIDDINASFGIGTKRSLLSQLNDEGKNKAQEYIQLLIKSGLYEPEKISTTVPRKLRFYDLPVSAGTGQLLDSDQFSLIEVGEGVSSQADFGVRISGDSMEPLYCDKQIVWVHEQPIIGDGQIGVFFLNGEAYIKKYHRSENGIELLSLNPNYSPIPVGPEANFKIFGKVVS